jgi:urease accessory protein
MQRATQVAHEAPCFDTVTLDHDARHRRRMRLVTDGGFAFLLDLPEARLLHDGDRLVLEDGRAVLVRAAPEPLLELVCSHPHALVRLAWHLGNRHLPTQLLGDRLRIRRDHVIAEMAMGLGAEVREIEAPFDPDGGAYGAGHGLGHD